MREQLGKIKQHFINHKKEYGIAAVGAVVGGAVVYVSIKFKNGTIAVLESPISNVLNVNGNENAINVFNTVMQNIGNLDNPSIPVYDVTTNTAYRSITHAAAQLGLNARQISWHLKGNLADVCGHQFVRLITENS